MVQIQEDKTLIQVSKETWQRLKDLRIAKRESFDEILNRVIPWDEILKDVELKKQGRKHA